MLLRKLANRVIVSVVKSRVAIMLWVRRLIYVEGVRKR